MHIIEQWYSQALQFCINMVAQPPSMPGGTESAVFLGPLKESGQQLTPEEMAMDCEIVTIWLQVRTLVIWQEQSFQHALDYLGLVAVSSLLLAWDILVSVHRYIYPSPQYVVCKSIVMSAALVCLSQYRGS
jgi:hypothetical protein